MEISDILRLIAVLACPIVMGAAMWLMGKNMNNQANQALPGDQTPAAPAERLPALRVRQQLLEAEITQAAQLVELEASSEATPASPMRGDVAISETPGAA